jgi:hypothetical protein
LEKVENLLCGDLKVFTLKTQIRGIPISPLSYFLNVKAKICWKKVG